MRGYNYPWTTIYCVDSSFLGQILYAEILLYRPDVYSIVLTPTTGLTRIYKNSRLNLIVL